MLITESELAILIVTYNSEAAIKHCLDSIPAKWRSAVIVTDNASEDRTVEVSRSYGVRILQRETNDGFGIAANEAAQAASARYLLLLNPDCILPSNFFSHALQAIRNETQDCYVPETLEEGQTLIAGCQPGYTRWKLIDDMLHTNYGTRVISEQISKWSGYHNHSWNWPHGACLLVARDRFLSLGGFDPRFFLYTEDVDLGHRLQEAGCRIRNLNCRVTHVRSSGALISNRNHLLHLNNGRIKYAEIHYGMLLSVFLRMLIIPAQALGATFEGKR